MSLNPAELWQFIFFQYYIKTAKLYICQSFSQYQKYLCKTHRFLCTHSKRGSFTFRPYDGGYIFYYFVLQEGTANRKFGSGSTDMPIFLDELVCNGSESSITQCRSSGWGRHNCYHHEDVGAICHNTTGIYSTVKFIYKDHSKIRPTLLLRPVISATIIEFLMQMGLVLHELHFFSFYLFQNQNK